MSTVITFGSALAACGARDRLAAAFGRDAVCQQHCKVLVAAKARAEVFAALPPYIRRGAIFEVAS